MVRLLTRLIAAFCFFLQIIKVEAHPGIGMVYDGKNIIYYTDLQHIWYYDLKDGKAPATLKR